MTAPVENRTAYSEVSIAIPLASATEPRSNTRTAVVADGVFLDAEELRSHHHYFNAAVIPCLITSGVAFIMGIVTAHLFQINCD